MTPFAYQCASDVADAIARVGRTDNAQFIAGGTSQVDLLKEGVQRPAALVDIFRIGLDDITEIQSGGLRIGANVRNSVASDHPIIRERYTAVAEALHSGASQQIRNMASMAGNLLQRTRCPYLRDPAQPCNKRDPRTGCAAVRGFNRLHAIFGQTDEGPKSSRTCIAVHPSDMAVAMAALESVIVIESGAGERRIERCGDRQPRRQRCDIIKRRQPQRVSDTEAAVAFLLRRDAEARDAGPDCRRTDRVGGLRLALGGHADVRVDHRDLLVERHGTHGGVRPRICRKGGIAPSLVR